MIDELGKEFDVKIASVLDRAMAKAEDAMSMLPPEMLEAGGLDDGVRTL